MLIQTIVLTKQTTNTILIRDSFIRLKIQTEDPVTFTHLKRVRKLDGPLKTLRVIVCSVEFINDEADCISLLKNGGFNYENLACDKVVPRRSAPTKELVMKWSQIYWPLTWCGNPNDQILNDYQFEMNFIRRMLAQITTIAKDEVTKKGQYPIVTAFVNPNDREHPIISLDKRAGENSFSLDHSIMVGIKKVAENLKKENIRSEHDANHTPTYLCLDFDVYTTHEPCSMCAMALVHSRIRRCIFIRSMPQTGSLKAESGDGYCMHNNKLLNSKYEVFQWLGDEYPATDLAPGVCC